MSTPEFERQVLEALGAIPHDCGDHFGSCGRAENAHSPACEIDYKQRIAQRVAAAMHKTDSFCPWWATHGGLTPEQSAQCRAEIWDAALRALAPEGDTK